MVLSSFGCIQATEPIAIASLAPITMSSPTRWSGWKKGTASLMSARIADCSASWQARSEEHTSELQSLMRISYAVFCLKKKKNKMRHINKQICTKQQHENII